MHTHARRCVLRPRRCRPRRPPRGARRQSGLGSVARARYHVPLRPGCVTMGPYRLLDVALALLARHARALEGLERAWLEVLPAIDAQTALQEVCAKPTPEDAPLLGLRHTMRLSDAELVAVALAAAVES